MPWPKGKARDKPGAEHALKNRFRPDPRSEDELKREGGGRRGIAQRRNREYHCTCGHSYGNVVEADARSMHKDHRRSVGAD